MLFDNKTREELPAVTIAAMRAMPDKELYAAELRLINAIAEKEEALSLCGADSGRLIMERRDLDIQIVAGTISQKEGDSLVLKNHQALSIVRDKTIDLNHELSSFRVALNDFSKECQRRREAQRAKDGAMLAQYAEGRFDSLQQQFVEIAAELCVLARWKHGTPWELLSPERIMTLALVGKSGDKYGLNAIRALDGELSKKVLRHE